MKITTILSTLILFIALSAPTAFSAGKKKAAAPPPAEPAPKAEVKKDHYPLMGSVVSITDTLLVTKGAEGSADHKFDITKDTKIYAGDKEKAAKVSDVKVGQRVTGYVHKMEKGNPELVSLNVAPIDKKGSEEKKAEPVTTTTASKKKK